MRYLSPLPILLALLAARAPAASGVPDVVRWDWHFRESLVAIRDWEDILARWEEATPEAERVPVMPVPVSGEAVEWPNPIPASLIPPEDRGLTVRLSLAADQVALDRSGAAPDVEQDTVALGKVALGYQHPGGGGADRWYHRYHRRFDGLTRFRPQAAPFALQIATPCDLAFGDNTLTVALRNVTDQPLALTAKLRLLSPAEDRDCAAETVSLGSGEERSLRLPVTLAEPGGRLLILSLQAGEQSFWLPLLTHVEDTPAVLASVEQLLADEPDAGASESLHSLRQQVAARLTAPNQAAGWRPLFEEASALRDDLLLRRLAFDSLLFVKRKPFDSEQPFMDAHHLRNRPGGGLYRLSPARPDGAVTPVVDSLGEGVYRDLCLAWDASRFLFAFGNGNDAWDGGPSYHIYEAKADGSGLQQLTEGPKNDAEPFYLPNGRIGFTSDRSEHFVMCGADRHAPNLFEMEADGSNAKALSLNCFNDFNPAVLPDGRIIYSRWEYNERSVTSLHNPFTVNPDGTVMAPFYGNATIRPNVVMFPRPVPDSHKVMALFTAHHGQTHGPIALIDQRRGLDGDDPLTILTPNIPTTGEKAEDSRYGWFSDPWPLSETLYLCSYTPTVVPWHERSWALYVGDRHGNLALLYRDPEIGCAEPVPLVPRERPHPLPPAPLGSDSEEAEATLLLLDAHINLPDVPRGEARYLRILEDVPRVGVHWGGVVTNGATGIYTIKRILGEVPIAADGSAYFTVPANRNVYFEVLDQDHLEIQRMRSVVCLKPREVQTCIGCHEPRTTAPPNLVSAALRRPPSRPVPPPWGTETLSFLRDVQPILNARCLGCHAHDRAANRVILTDELTDQFTIGYQELLRYIATANAMRWDLPDDVYARPPYTYGSKVSPLMKLLRDGHYGVALSEDERLRLAVWIDANGVYYDRYETSHFPNRSLFSGERRAKLDDVYGRRCADCHGDGGGEYGNWWLSLNRREVAQTRALRAPLSAVAGGWQQCEEVVFQDPSDPDYQALLAVFASLRDYLADHPREDLLSLRGTPAEQQVVTFPAPPGPRPPRPPEVLDGNWVYLSDVEWESGHSGWTPNGDNLPRRDRDVENSRLNLSGRRYRKGLGTHAPSEIAYRLDGRFARFVAVIGGAEEGGTVTFCVFGDDRLLYESPAMQGLRDSARLDLPVTGVQRLRLVVTDAGDGINADVANWADARLLPR